MLIQQKLGCMNWINQKQLSFLEQYSKIISISVKHYFFFKFWDFYESQQFLKTISDCI